MNHSTTDVSDALELVMVNDVPAVTVYDRNPAVPPGVFLLRKIRVVDVTDVFDTVTVPATRVETPILAFVPSLTANPPPAVPATNAFAAPVKTVKVPLACPEDMAKKLSVFSVPAPPRYRLVS